MGDVMRRAYEKGWITTRDGNVSLRRASKSTLYITPSGWRKTIIHPEHMIKIKMKKDGSLKIPDGTYPSGELEMHHKLQELHRNKTQAVVHLHPTNIIAENSYFITTQKILQHQYMDDFSQHGMLSLKSSTNFRCQYYKSKDCSQALRELKISM